MTTMKLLSLLLVASATKTANAFVPPSPVDASIKSVKKMSDKPFEMPFDISELQSTVSDYVSKGIPLNEIKENVMEGEFGSRGEPYVAAQLGLLLCILLGGIPVIGDLLMLLLGPGLMLTGAGVMFASITELGTSLSPWPVPSSSMKKLNTDGLYAELRHPLYAGLLSFCAGFSIVTGSANRLLLTAVLFYALSVKCDYEEKELIKYFPDYNQYKNKVQSKFVPESVLNQLPWISKERAAIKSGKL